MAVPDVVITVQDNALGVAPENTDNYQVKCGTCSLGTANTIYTFNDIETLKSTLGTGPLVNHAAEYLIRSGGPVYCVPIAQTAAGAIGSVTNGGPGASTITISAATAPQGTPAYPRDQYKIQVQMVTVAVAPEDSTFVYSLDSGNTWSEETAVDVDNGNEMGSSGLVINWDETAWGN